MLICMYIELATGVSTSQRDRHDSRGSHGESDDDSTDLDDENYNEVEHADFLCVVCCVTTGWCYNTASITHQR